MDIPETIPPTMYVAFGDAPVTLLQEKAPSVSPQSSSEGAPIIKKYRGKKKGDKPDLLTKEEMDKLLLIVSSDTYYYTLYNFLLHSGRRIGEIYGTQRGNEITGGIQVKDINFKDKTAKTMILKTKKRKLQVECLNPLCKKLSLYKNTFCPYCASQMPIIKPERLLYSVSDVRTMPLKDNVLTLLEMYIKKTKKGQEDFLFREKSLSAIKKIIKVHTLRAGITKNFSVHGFRHYFVTQCKRAGMSNEKIALWTGHVRPDTLNIYTHMAPREVEAEIMEVEL